MRPVGVVEIKRSRSLQSDAFPLNALKTLNLSLRLRCCFRNGYVSILKIKGEFCSAPDIVEIISAQSPYHNFQFDRIGEGLH